MPCKGPEFDSRRVHFTSLQSSSASHSHFVHDISLASTFHCSENPMLLLLAHRLLVSSLAAKFVHLSHTRLCSESSAATQLTDLDLVRLPDSDQKILTSGGFPCGVSLYLQQLEVRSMPGSLEAKYGPQAFEVVVPMIRGVLTPANQPPSIHRSSRLADSSPK